MSVYARFKRNPDGFRSLVELLETTPAQRRQKMIDIGMAEDPDYTQKAMSYMMTFEDILHLPDVELAEVLAKAPPRIIGFAIKNVDEGTRVRFLRNATPQVAAEVRSYMETQVGLREIGGAQLKMIETARQLERKGLVRIKRIPLGAVG